MQPIGPLMIEHRLIERMVKLMQGEVKHLDDGAEPDLNFVDLAVDFVRFYADCCHHGKEEDILFKALDKKGMSQEHRRIMNELIQEHVWGRQTLGRLEQARKDFAAGNKQAFKNLKQFLKELADFYPQHIVKEDKHFFIPVMDYFSRPEQDAMLHEEYDFDKNLIHEKYQAVVASVEKSRIK